MSENCSRGLLHLHPKNNRLIVNTMLHIWELLYVSLEPQREYLILRQSVGFKGICVGIYKQHLRSWLDILKFLPFEFTLTPSFCFVDILR